MKITMIQGRYENVWEALGLGYIIAYVKKHYKSELEINFFQGKFDSDDDIILGSKDSDIVAFSCTSPAYAHGLSMAGLIKHLNPKVHTVFGGWHPTALPREVIKEDCVDQVIVGEGEYAMRLILSGYRGMPVVFGEKLPPEELPWPDREAIKNERTIDLCESMNGKRTASFQMNRGCKVHCKFCAEQGMTGKYNKVTNPIRSRTNDDVLDEINHVHANYNIDYFKFVDATFDINPEQVIDFCAAKIERENEIEWEANIHPRFIQKEEVFAWLKESNCNQINIGVESGSPGILKDIGKGTRIEHIKNVFKWARKYGIKRRGFFLLGMPNEQYEDMKLTEELIDEIEPDVVGFTILCPYPGSDFYDPEKHKDVDWSATDEYSNDFWRTEYYSNSEIKGEQKILMAMHNDKLCERQDDTTNRHS